MTPWTVLYWPLRQLSLVRQLRLHPMRPRLRSIPLRSIPLRSIRQSPMGIGAIALVGSLVGCGGDGLADRQQQMIDTATTEAAKNQLAAMDAEQLYLMAYSSCPMLQSGATVDSLSQQLVTQADDPSAGPSTDPSTAVDFFAAIVSVAETTVCPEDFEGWTGTP